MNAIVSEKRAAVSDLAAKHHARRLAVFGSAASGAFDARRSDVDMVVDFEPMAPGDHAAHYFDLLEALERLFGRHVDLVERSAIRNPYVRDAVAATEVILYVAA